VNFVKIKYNKIAVSEAAAETWHHGAPWQRLSLALEASAAFDSTTAAHATARKSPQGSNIPDENEFLSPRSRGGEKYWSS